MDVNGQKGDQTGKEVCIDKWMECLLRPKNPNKAEIMAQSCEKGCANPAMGYSQYKKYTSSRS